MNHISIFLQTKIEESGPLACIGDIGLAPFRYLFNGKTIRIQSKEGTPELTVHHVASFHKWGQFNSSKTNSKLYSSSTNKLKTLVSVIFLIPGLALSVFKLLAYFSINMRARHTLTREHFTPVNREIGTAANPIITIEALRAALIIEHNKPKHQPTNALIIHGNGHLEINEDPGILDLNPMKLILEGARIVHRPSAIGRLDDEMYRSGKWQIPLLRRVSSAQGGASAKNEHRVSTVEEALSVTAPLRNWTSCKRYHMIFNIDRLPQVVRPIV